ncbi:MAG: isoprenyl transferase [Bacteroidales bacterium]|jgi:undecaprenyl diphosphate synthase|nr:isoprenyl transferase [Bacteroidales bacterium]
MSAKDKLNLQQIPQHIAIIMDGNGRWAEQRGQERIFGHKHGVESVREAIEGAAEIGVKFLTLYAFSTENWNRPKDEIEGLMELMIDAINNEADNLNKNNVRLRIIGDTERLSERVKNKIKEAVDKLNNNSGLTLVVALSYSSRWEITETVKNIAIKVKNAEISIDEIDENLISESLKTNFMPDPELIIRTSAEKRLSNFLLWQASYSEFAFIETLWPDFTKETLFETINEFQNRERRFGKTGRQVQDDK